MYEKTDLKRGRKIARFVLPLSSLGVVYSVCNDHSGNLVFFGVMLVLSLVVSGLLDPLLARLKGDQA